MYDLFNCKGVFYAEIKDQRKAHTCLQEHTGERFAK